jgi:hypothetical protein
MINALADHLKTYPENVRQKISFIQCPAGTSGDPQPWNGTPTDIKYNIDVDSKAWEEYNIEIFSAYIEAFQDFTLDLTILIKSNEATSKAILNKYPTRNIALKTFGVAQGYQTNSDFDTEWHRNLINKFGNNGRAIRSRGEVDHIDWLDVNWYTEAPVWNIYTHCLWTLTYGLDVLNFREQHVTGTEATNNATAFQFFSNYSGYKAAEDSHGAWCALRDGLDYDDKVRFPENIYGIVSTGKNIDRYQKIANAFSARGAQMGETEYCWYEAVEWTKYATAMNDVARSPWKDNYGMFMTQYKPNETSAGYWRVGSKSEPYGRFARGFEYASGKNNMYFNINDAFFYNKPLAGEYPVTVRIVYFDQGIGKWELRYDAADNIQKTALAITKTNSGSWKAVTVELTDAYFGNRCTGGSDLMLVNTDAEDDIFHMIEVTRKAGDRKGYWGYKSINTDIVNTYTEKAVLRTISNYLKNTIDVRFFIDKAMKVGVKIFTLNGRLIFTDSCTFPYGNVNWQIMPANRLSKGLYILKMELNGKIQTSKLVVY